MHEARELHPKDFWTEYGWEDQDLMKIARRVTAQPTPMTSGERNWKDHSEVHCPRRNRLGPEKARDLVFVKHSLRLQESVHKWEKERATAAAESSSDEE